MKRYLLEMAGETSEHRSFERAQAASRETFPFMEFGREVQHEAGYRERWGVDKSPTPGSAPIGSGMSMGVYIEHKIIAVECEVGAAAETVEKLRRKLEEKRAAVLREHAEFTRKQPPLVLEGNLCPDYEGMMIGGHTVSAKAWGHFEHPEARSNNDRSLGHFRITIECLGVDA